MGPPSYQVWPPDVVFVARECLNDTDRVIDGPADLAEDIVSFEGRQRDHFDKRDLYERYEIKEYWMIDPEAKPVEVLFLQAGTYVPHGRFGVGQSAESQLLNGFVIAVDGLSGDAAV